MKGFVYGGGIVLFSLLFLMPYFYVYDPFFIRGLFLSLFLSFLMKKRKIRFSSIDGCLLLIFLFSGISFYTATNINAEITAFVQSSYILLYYFVLRFWLEGMKEIRGLLSGYVVCIGLLSILATAFFYQFLKDVHEMEFSSLYDFRFLFQPLGVPSNEWASLQILFGGITLLALHYCRDMKRRKWIVRVGILVFLQILWSFSRGMYLSMLVWGIGILFIARKTIMRRGYRQVLGTSFLVLIVFLFVYPQEVKQTLKMNETVSQQRSIDSRLNMWNLTDTIIKDYPWGTGSFTYPMVMDKYLQQDNRAEGYSSYATNLISQLLVEKGVIGFILYLFFAVVVLFYVVQRKEKKIWLVFIILLVFLFREQTFSVFLNSTRVQLLIYTLLALMQVSLVDEFQNEGKQRWHFYFLPLLIWGTCLMSNLWIDRNNRLNAKSCLAAQNEEWNKAVDEIEKTERIAPYLINRGLVYLNLYDSLSDEQYLEKADIVLEEAQKQNPYDVQPDYYRLMIRDREKGKEGKNLPELKRLAARYPDKLLYKWTLYEWYYRKQDWGNAATSLKDCVLEVPRILDAKYWKKKTAEDADFIRDVESLLKIEIAKEPVEDPVVWAKYGSVSLKLGNLFLAEKYLEGALNRLPNLSMAWHNLGKLAEMKGEKAASTLYKKRANILGVRVEKFELDRLLDGSYNFRFRIWYGCEKVKW